MCLFSLAIAFVVGVMLLNSCLGVSKPSLLATVAKVFLIVCCTKQAN